MLDKEEQEYLDQVRAKYKLMKIHMSRRMAEIKDSDKKENDKEQEDKQTKDNQQKESSKDDKREPVFVWQKGRQIISSSLTLGRNRNRQ